MVFKLGLLGLGTVGTGTADILLNPEGRNPLLKEIEIKSVGVRSLDKARKVTFPEGVLTDDLESIVSDPDIDIVVELMGGLEPVRSLLLKAIANGKHIVTANKAAIAMHGAEIFDAAQEAGVYVLLEAAVGGGIPILKPLKEALGVNRISRITGIVNGTTNYILTQMATHGANFADVLAEAQSLGYAEADPTADVDGLDAADKIAILASLAFGGRIKREDVYTEGITKVDAADISYAKQLGFTIKLLAIAQQKTTNGQPQETLQLRVHPTLLPKNHPLASINGVYNAVLVEGEPIEQVMFFGPGAGAGPTASAVVSDIISIVGILKSAQHSQRLNPLLSPQHQHYCAIAPMSELVTRFYARFLCDDHPGVIGHLGTCFGKHNVSLESVVQIGYQDSLAEIVVVTHDVTEANFHNALAEIRGFSPLDNISIASVLRVW